MQSFEQKATKARQELAGLRGWLGGQGVTLQQWTDSVSADFVDFKRETDRRMTEMTSEMRGAGTGGMGATDKWQTRGIFESKVWSGVRTISLNGNDMPPYKEWQGK